MATDKFLIGAWGALDGSKRTRSILEGTELKVMGGDVRVATASLVTDGTLVLWNPNRVQSYTNTLPATCDRIGDCSRVLKPIIEATGFELPEAIKYRLRTSLGKRFILGMGHGYASMTCNDPDCGFCMEDGGPLECDGFLDGYGGEPFAHGFIYETVAKIMRRFAVTRVEMCPRAEPMGYGALKFQGTFKGHEVFLAIRPAYLEPGDEDHAIDLVRDWSGRKPRKK